ncbi:phosphoenolpyruvate--protein phosphotransferase [Ktedonobacter racemifer]|uniref:Phosphoenolpyruvate-protein phosphotransferase n=1 Tax=Ktedonobacter racemifer DSM 44963 TaxID=485913 RepID=D6TE12_KTERA|nr:phosphoenolpyruvate--protein phosphotransferase [Ktedonobacter racemifer]EFH88385.1 phosphoenolpyruvate-protein phosphotransferase [Ktedonobacter racemifer DSM 44963]
MPTTTLRGVGASPGIAIGHLHHYAEATLNVAHSTSTDPAREKARLEEALAQARQEIQALATQARHNVGAGEAAIFEAHEMFLDDPELLDRVDSMLQQQQVSAAYAWQESTQQAVAELRAIDDEYLAARATDLQDVAQRVLRIIQGVEEQKLALSEPAIIVAQDLTPSQTIQFENEKIRAFCIAEGGPTSHVAILAKALGIPAITGLGKAIESLHDGQRAIVNGASGEIILDPDKATLATYQQEIQALTQAHQEAFQDAHQPATTRDGHTIEVVANIGTPEQVAEALHQGADGVGLLRTEFLFMEREAAPDENEQYAIYRSILQAMDQRPVVVRTFDIGGDKPASYLHMSNEMNPFLGIRGARLALEHNDLLQAQLSALLRAGEGHNLKIMFPMVSSLEEVEALRVQVQQTQATLSAQNTRYAQQVEIGIMVEVPAAAVMADVIAPHVDFFSIGTNDLTQYVMAADRTNSAVAHLADALHPAVLRFIRMVIDAAHTHGKWVGLCGELAGNPLAAVVLLGLGLDEFSMTASFVPLVKQRLRQLGTEQARAIALHALSLPNAQAVHAYLESLT